jgi:hypothetical protein
MSYSADYARELESQLTAARAELAQYKAAANQILAWCDAAEHPEWDVGADLPSVQTAILRTCLASALSGEDQK